MITEELVGYFRTSVRRVNVSEVYNFLLCLVIPNNDSELSGRHFMTDRFNRFYSYFIKCLILFLIQDSLH